MLKLYMIILCSVLFSYRKVHGAPQNGTLILYRPLDCSSSCAYSSTLRYDLTFGMGLSDTISLIFRTLKGVDYECNVEIVSEMGQYLIFVVKFPTNIFFNCHYNEDAFMFVKGTQCSRLCDVIDERSKNSPYFVTAVEGQTKFRFLSNGSINSEMNAQVYQVTATAARRKPKHPCQKNETLCIVQGYSYCFTSGVVCDGIKNCGVSDWFDERQSECSLHVEYLNYASVIAVIGAVACALLALGHILIRGLKPLSNAFFIFNANEDNRLYLDPITKAPNRQLSSIEQVKRVSLIPVFSSTSSSLDNIHEAHGPTISNLPSRAKSHEELSTHHKRSTVKMMKTKIQQKLLSVTGRVKSIQNFETDVQADI